MNKTAQIVNLKEERRIRRTTNKQNDYKQDFSKFRKILDSTKKE